jgi:hypothetical protein
MGIFTESQFMELWYSNTQTAERKLKKFLDAGLDRKVMAGSDIMSKIKKGEMISTPVKRWMEEWDYPQAITATLATTTLTISGYLFGAAVTAETINKVLRIGTILERPSDGVQVRVSSMTGVDDGTPFAATVAAHGNSSLSDDSTAITWDIIGELWKDSTDASTTRSLERGFREVGCQIHEESFQILKSRKNTKYEIVGDEAQHQMSRLLDKMRRSLAMACIRMRPTYSGGYKYGNAVEESAMCGIFAWPIITQAEMANTDVYVNKAQEELTKDDINNLVKRMWLDELSNFNRGDWWIVCHPNTAEYINQFDLTTRQTTRKDTGVGYEVKTFDSGIGKSFPILADPYMRADTLGVLNFASMSWGYFNDDELDRKELPTMGRYQQWMISMQTWGVQVRDPRSAIGTIYGLPT